MSSPKRVLSVFSLVMINVIAVDSLRTLPITAKLGLPLISYFFIAALVFFIPVALVSAELATAYPKTGGIYIWVREAFGKPVGFITIWLQWIYNVVWYPTILAFIAATIAYIFSPTLAQDPTFLLVTILGLFWLFTLLNCFGMKVSSLISSLGAIFGTIVPMLGIIILGIIWWVSGRPLALHAPYDHWLPDFSTWGNLSLFSAVLFGLLGIEMSAVHAEEVKNPQRDYPRALFYSTLIIFATLSLGSLAIVMVVPNENLSVVSGLIDAYASFFEAFKLSWMIPLTAACIVLGGLSCVSTWIIGPTKGMMAAASDNCLPQFLAKRNKHFAPTRLLMVQGVIFTALCSTFILVDSLNAAYWLLSDLCAQMALMVYVLMFAAAVKLRYTQPDRTRPYRIPGGNWGMWLTAGFGTLSSLFTIFIGFVPPSQIEIDNVMFFESFLLGGLTLFVLLPWLFAKKHLSES